MRRGSAAFAVIVLVGSVVGVTPLRGAAAVPRPQVAEMRHSTVAQAAVAARETGQRVEAEAETSETQQIFANPDGTLTLEQYTLPVRVRRGASWVPVDTTLVRRSDGSVGPVAASTAMSFSGGGSSPLVRILAGGRELSLDWPGELPAPVLEGDTATYPQVLPDVDLVVTAGVLGFSEVLVVKTPQAALNEELTELRFTQRATRLDVKLDGAANVDAVDENEQSVFHAGTPLMWDSGGEPVQTTLRAGGPANGARQSPIRVVTDPDGLVLRPDPAFLSDPHLHFPLYLDPSVSYSGGRLAWTSVWKAHPNSSYFNSSDIARVGHENDTGMTNRSIFRMNTSAVRGKHIIRATFRTYLAYSWSCSARAVELWRTGAISAATTWNRQPAWAAKLATVSTAKGYSGSCPAGGVEFNATAGAVTAAAGNWTELNLGLRATSETDTFAWKKFRNNPVLVIDYNTKPNVPTNLSTDPGLPCVTGANRPVVGTATPTIRAKISDADAQPVGARFEWWVTGGAKIGEKATTRVQAAAVHSAVVPAGAFANGKTYSWRVRAEDGIDVSAFAGWCELTVDLSPPGKAPVVTSGTYPETPPGQDPVYKGAVGLSGTFTLSPGAGDADVAAYVYGLNQFPPATPVPATGTGRTAAVTLTPTTDLLNTLYVRSRDAAGNLGPIYGYQFHVRPVTFPTGHWALDQAGDDTSGDNHAAAPAGATSWTAGRIGGALRLAGSDGYAATTAPVLRTDLSFTVTAWVRLTGTGKHFTAVSQDGTRNSGYYLQYDLTSDRWAMALPSTDTDTEITHRALSTNPPARDVWTHLAGVYDKSTGQVRLYVDGVLQGTVAHGPAWNATGPMQIGRARWRGMAVDPWAGDIDDVRVYQGVLPAQAITGLANPPATLVGHWQLDETAGTSAADASGSGRSATLTGGAAWAPGWVDGALDLDGTSGEAATPGPVLRTDQSFTVAAWVRLTAEPGQRDYAVAGQDGAVASGFRLEYRGGTDRWAFAMPTADSTAESIVSAVSTQPPARDTWTHVAGVYDASAHHLRLYVDGVLVALVTHANAWHAAGPLRIGAAKRLGTVADRWHGGVDDVRVYQGALDDDEIFQLTQI